MDKFGIGHDHKVYCAVTISSKKQEAVIEFFKSKYKFKEVMNKRYENFDFSGNSVNIKGTIIDHGVVGDGTKSSSNGVKFLETENDNILFKEDKLYFVYKLVHPNANSPLTYLIKFSLDPNKDDFKFTKERWEKDAESRKDLDDFYMRTRMVELNIKKLVKEEHITMNLVI